MAVFKLADAQYNVVTAGAGPSLMLLHGFTGGAQSWDHLKPALSPRFAMILPDLPGHGITQASDDPARYRMERCVADLIAILDALDIERTHLLGYSMGGRLALAAAIEHQDRIASLILESASPGLADAAERRARVASDNALADLIERDGIEAFVARWERMPLFATQERLPQAVRARLAAQSSGQQSQGAGQQFARARHRRSALAMGAAGRAQDSEPDNGRRNGPQVQRDRAQHGGGNRGLASGAGAGRGTYHPPGAARGVCAPGA